MQGYEHTLSLLSLVIHSQDLVCFKVKWESETYVCSMSSVSHLSLQPSQLHMNAIAFYFS
jgi:hypothetical protein